MSNDSIEQSIREVAARHGVALSRDDPLLIVQTLNEQLVKNLAIAQSEMLEQFRRDLELTCSQWREDAKVKSERILNEALATSRRALEDDLSASISLTATKLTGLASQHTEVREIALARVSFIGILNTVLLLTLFLCIIVGRVL